MADEVEITVSTEPDTPAEAAQEAAETTAIEAAAEAVGTAAEAVAVAAEVIAEDDDSEDDREWLNSILENLRSEMLAQHQIMMAQVAETKEAILSILLTPTASLQAAMETETTEPEEAVKNNPLPSGEADRPAPETRPETAARAARRKFRLL